MDLLAPIIDALKTEGLLSQQAVGEILKRHQTVGGAPDTVILEKLDLDAEGRLRLLSALSQVVGRPPTLASGLEMPMPQALEALSPERRRQWVVLPYAEVGRTLYVATTALPVFDDATFSKALGRPVRTTVTLEVDLWAAFERLGQGQMPERLTKLLPPGAQVQRQANPQPSPEPEDDGAQPNLDPLATLPPVEAKVLLRRLPDPAPVVDDPFASEATLSTPPAATPTPAPQPSPPPGPPPPPPPPPSGPTQVFDPFVPSPKTMTSTSTSTPAPVPPPPAAMAPPQHPAPATPAPETPTPAPQQSSPASFLPLVRALDDPDAPLAVRAQRALLAGGAHGLEALFEVFPGRLRVDRYTTDPWALSAPYHSGVLATIAAFGTAAGPGLVVRLGDPSPEIRYYAAFLLAEIEHPDAALALCGRLFDRDPGVRSVSALALDARRGQAGFELAIKRVVEGLKGSPIERRAAAEAAGRMRLASSVPGLVGCLSNPAPGMVDPIHRALRAITGHDLGKEPIPWREWYSKHRHKHRLEWLLEGLTHGNARVQGAIWRELVILAGRDLGDPVRGTTQTRTSARRSWRAWWEEEGRKKFPRWA
ncbi:MAG: HEAT repeat domain-containing protein [Bradymonadia bacterium]